MEKGKKCFQYLKWKGCLKKVRDKISSSISIPERPNKNDCTSWENYYTDLRRAFFLSRGKFSPATKEIKNIIRSRPSSKDWGENYYFSANEELASFERPYRSYNPFNDRLNDKEHRHAVKFFTGKLLEASDRSTEKLKTIAEKEPQK